MNLSDRDAFWFQYMKREASKYSVFAGVLHKYLALEAVAKPTTDDQKYALAKQALAHYGCIDD